MKRQIVMHHTRKKNRIQAVLLVFIFFAYACSMQQQERGASGAATAVLKDTVGWATTLLDDGLVRMNYEGYYAPYSSNQNVNVLSVDLKRYALAFEDIRPSDSLSAVADEVDGAVAGINGTYYEIARNEAGDSVSSSFFKTAGVVKSRVTVPEDHRLYWKHEGAFFYDNATDKWGIVYGDADSYEKMPYANVLSGAPVLIHREKPVGAAFAKAREMPLDSLDYEDPDRHQGVRHPRTALAITTKGQLLLITVDGRREETAGMSAKELTQFITRYFEVTDALNIDGGGSTTLWVRGATPPNGVVNYPTDNKRYDHFGQRKIRNAILVVKKDGI
ncbi:phosphodiester glycosidase family protein [Parapedobacter sp. ISTM3]|uniref:phosphodiester glycosidase family protein n=1 Tax=Parapedobacter sp. ISTM3 TaxID=2800130 RepID=UPI0019089A25|nr:phosphodiester glycosidase family protein [Parapedobacter sp. ISTM3]MBK1438884.1 phosphodiester glycosidase family protein [Parapedobacter sp. ISTM3]